MWFQRNGHRIGPTLVLSGGGAMGALQAGLLSVLVRHGFKPGRIVGTSVGALNGAFLAFYPDEAGIERLLDIWRSLENDRYITFNPLSMAYRVASRQLSLFNNEFLQRLVEEHTVTDDFAATKVPLHITATNLNTGGKHVFTEGPVSLAVLASTAIPGAFSPVEIDGVSYVDGGVTANLDLETACALGSREILGIDLSHCFKLPQPDSVFGVITRTVDIVMRDRVARDLVTLGRRARITLIQPEIERGPGVGDLRHTSTLIDQGIALGEELLDRCFDARGRLRPAVIHAPVLVPS